MEIVFTPASILELLAQIEELKDCELSLSQTIDNKIQLQIDDSIYILDTEYQVPELQVEENVIDEIGEINESTYKELIENDEMLVDEVEPIEGGILKELATSLLLGGMIKLTKKLL